jgi:magnesium-transporting ATPase (P-type)
MADPPRPAAAEAIARAHEAGVRVVMLTGDQVPTARARPTSSRASRPRTNCAWSGRCARRARSSPLRRADIGIAMGESGTDAAKQTADLILTDDNLGTVVAAIEEGRTIYANIAKTVHLLFSHNLSEVLAVFVALSVGLPLPLLPLQILWMNVVTDIFPACALRSSRRNRSGCTDGASEAICSRDRS